MSIVVQSTFQNDIQYNSKEKSQPRTFWILREYGDASDEYRITVDQDGNYCSEDVKFQSISKNLYKLVINSTTTYNLHGPSNHFPFGSNPHVNITAVAVHSNLMAVGDSNGSINILNRITDKIVLTITQAHFSDITSLKFFPSGKVLISGSLDMQLKLWSVADGSNPRTLVGHKGAITGISLLGKTGRNLLSSSNDGTVKLWETGSASNLHSFKRISNLNDSATCICSYKQKEASHMQDTAEEEGESDIQTDGLHFETTGIRVYVGYESGNIQEFNVQEHSQTSVKFPQIGDSISVTALSMVSGENLVIAGYSNGVVKIWGKEKTIEYAFPEQIINIVGQERAFIVNSGGKSFKLIYNKEAEELQLDSYMIGIESVNDIACDGKFTAAGGKEGLVGFK
ncbi:26S proteasome regulatory subunit Rpn14p [[Candida] railenensis]|uniref:26S proteasome regulatory subunit Rpn14p n=1 Tax=[Candida] railenensis TaxID=45579 RepID=A0A9P0QVC0_9ASCO|nr:26S proteasome regulatory subunit Rpn14p [[Candida] railenensis]